MCHSNRAAAYLNLGLFEEALWDAMRCQKLADKRFWRDRDAISVAPIYVKAFARRGFALMGLRNPRQAKLEFEKGLRMNPEHAECKRGIEEATEAMLADLMAGRGKETLALPASSKVAGRITTLPHAAALHHIHPRNMLPVRLLTPFQADNDYHVKDTYNYVTVQADMEMPKRHFRYLEDTTRRTAFADAVTLAVDRLREDAKDARVLNIGCGAGLVAMEALRAGAHHVTATDRWLYHAMAAKESLLTSPVSAAATRARLGAPSKRPLTRLASRTLGTFRCPCWRAVSCCRRFSASLRRSGTNLISRMQTGKDHGRSVAEIRGSSAQNFTEFQSF